MQKRITERLRALGMAQVELAEKVGVSRQVVNGWVKGRGTPRDKEQLARVADALQCSVAFLLYGERSEHDEAPDSDAEYISIPCFDVKAACGKGIENFDACMVKLIKVALPWLRAHVRSGSFRHLNVITAAGDSMEPAFKDGDLVLIDTSEKEAHSDRVYCLVLDGELYLKRVQRIPGGLRLISDNSKYPPVDVTGDFATNVIICGAARCTLEAKPL